MIVSELAARLGIKVDSSSFAKANSLMNGLKIGMLGLAAVGAGVAFALKSVVEGTADQAREIQRTARITGMGTDALQGLNYAAKQSGVSAEELQHGLIHLARSAQEANLHGGAAGIAYSNLGIRVAGASGKLRPLNDIFAEVAQKLAKMPDGTQKAAMAMSLFGRAGAQLIPLLDQGPAGLAAFSEEARKLGLVMDEKTLAAANRYKMTLDRLDGAIQGLKNSISAALLPAFTKATEAFIRWISAHRQWIALKIADGFATVTKFLHQLWGIGTKVFHVFEQIWKSGGNGKKVLEGLGLAALALTAPWLSLAAVILLVAKDFNDFMNDKDSVIGRIAYALRRLWDYIRDGIAKDGLFGFLYNEMGGFFAWLGPKLDEIGPRIAKSIINAFPKTLSDRLGLVSAEESMQQDRYDRYIETGSTEVHNAGPARPLKSGWDRWYLSDLKNLGDHIGRWALQQPQLLDAGGSEGGDTNLTVPISIGQLSLSGSDLTGDAPKDFAEQLARHLGRALLPELNRVHREAYNAVNKRNAP